MRSGTSHQRYGITLIELLVVLFAGALALGVLVTAVVQVQGSAQHITRLDNLKQQAAAIHSYNDQFKSLPGNGAKPWRKSSGAYGPPAWRDPNFDEDGHLKGLRPAPNADQRKAPAGNKDHKYQAPAGDFAVQFPPGKVKYYTQPEPGAADKTLYFHLYVGQDNGVYGVLHLDLADSALGGTVDDAIDNFRDAYLDNQQAVLLAEEPILLGSYPGRAWKMESALSGPGLVRAYLVGRRIYMVAAFGDTQFLASAPTQRFMASFEVMGK